MREMIDSSMTNVMKNTRLFTLMLVILAISGLDTGCVSESDNNYNLASSVQKMQGRASMGKVSNASDAYSHAEFINDHDR